MKKQNFSLIAILILLLSILACSSFLPEPTSERTQPAVISTLELPQGPVGFPQTEAEVPRVTVEDAKAALDSGEAIIVDVRSPYAFADQHVAGAISIPLALVESDPSGLGLDKDQWIITYCT